MNKIEAMSKTKTFISFSRITPEGIKRILYRTQITPGKDSVRVGDGSFETPDDHVLYLQEIAESNTLYPTETLDTTLLESLRERLNNLLLQVQNENVNFNIKATMVPFSQGDDTGALLIDLKNKSTSVIERIEKSLIQLTVPKNIVAPSISGVSIVGRVAVVNVGEWSGFPTPNFSIQWKKNGVNIPGGQNRTWLPGDHGETFTVIVRATNSQGYSEESSLEVGPVMSGEITFDDLVLTFNDQSINMEY